MCDEKLKEIQELENTLKYYITSEMSIDRKISILCDSYWRSHNAGYCDYMAGQRMAGVDDEQVFQHDMDWKYKAEVERLIELLKELRNEEWEALWQEANVLYGKDNARGYKAWLALSDLGYAKAAHSVGWCLRYGNGTEQDMKKAEEYYTLAVRGGYLNSYANLYFVCLENGKPQQAMDYLFEGARQGSGDCYDVLARLCFEGEIFGGNRRVFAYLSCCAFEHDEELGLLLGYCYINGIFFPKVYPYAKYCIECCHMTRAEIEGGFSELPAGWDDIEPIKPKYPAFDLTLDTCEGAVDTDALMSKARELICADQPDEEAAKPYVLEAAKAGSTEAMYFTYLLGMEEAEDYLTRGADEYGDLDCIETVASLFSENATYKIGNIFLNYAVRYWNLRKKLHGSVAMSELAAKSYEKYSKGLDKALGRVTKEFDPNYNAVILHADGSYEKIKVDFDSLKGLCAALDCERINAISTQSLRGISEFLGFTVVMYCDERGMLKHLPENSRAAEMSGYDVIWGDVVICGFKDDYKPLCKEELEGVLGLLEIR